MAKSANNGGPSQDQLDAVLEEFFPGTLLKIKAKQELAGIKTLCDRIYYVVQLAKEKVSTEEILILSTSKESLASIDFHLGEKCSKTQKIKKITFTGLIAESLSQHFKNWTILEEEKIKEIVRILGGKVEIPYSKLKGSIQQLSAVTTKSLMHMNEHEVMVRFGLDREAALQVKKIVDNVFYVPYSQVIKESTKIPLFFTDLSKYKVICVANFHNLREEEANFLINLGNGKHITILANDSTKAKPKLLEQNWKLMSTAYKDGKIKEVHVNGDYAPEDSTNDNNYDQKDNSLIDQILKNKISLLNFEELIEVMLKVLNNKKKNLPFLQMLSLIPGFDNAFLKKFCKLVSSEKSSVFDFLIKYQDSLSNKTKAKILPILKYLSKIESKLDTSNANSIMIHMLNLCRALGVDTQATEDMKKQFVDLHLWLKFLQNNEQLRISDNLIECYIANGTFKSKPANNSLSQFKEGKPMEATLDIKFPVSIAMKGRIETREGDSAEVKIEDMPLRRSNSSRYKARPLSWHAGAIASAARKLK